MISRSALLRACSGQGRIENWNWSWKFGWGRLCSFVVGRFFLAHLHNYQQLIIFLWETDGCTRTLIVAIKLRPRFIENCSILHFAIIRVMRVWHSLGPGPDVSLQRDLVPATQGPVHVGDTIPEHPPEAVLDPRIVQDHKTTSDTESECPIKRKAYQSQILGIF